MRAVIPPTWWARTALPASGPALATTPNVTSASDALSATALVHVRLEVGQF
ncbi:MAG: hypothetical protein ACP5OV_08295 [Acidimicrobiales bacterium]